MKVDEICSLVSDHFSVSVLPHPTISDKEVTATFQTPGLEETLEALEFLTGRSVRESGGTFYIGGEGEEALAVVPAPKGTEGLNSISSLDAVVIGRSMVVSGDQAAITDAQRISQEISARADEIGTSSFRLVVLDISERDEEPFGEWLRLFQIGMVTNLDTAAGIGDTRTTTTGIAQAALNIEAVIQFVQGLQKSEVNTDTVVTLVDGEQLTISAGQVLEREINQSVPTVGGQSEFRTGFDRLNIGFDLELLPVRLNSGWQIQVRVSDSSFVNGTETRTEYNGSTVVRDFREGPVLLADLNREGNTLDEQRLNFGFLKRVKRFTVFDEQRRLVIYLAPLSASEIVEPTLRAVPVFK